MSAWGVIWRTAVALLGLAAFVPTNTTSLTTRAKPATGYETAMLLAQELQRADSNATSDGRSIVRVHGHTTPRAVVFFHGLTNSPRQYRALADSVFDSGDNVVVPRLPWHGLKGGTSTNLGKMTADALRDVADASINIASGLGDTVIVFGVSLGGNVAAWVAQFRPVQRVIVASPALGVSHLSTTFQTPTMNLMLRVPNYSKSDPPDTLRPDRTLGWSTRGVGEMMKLGAAVRKAADDTRPLARDIRVLTNASDATINRSAVDELVEHWWEKGAPVVMYEMADTLKLPHDIVDPDEATGRTVITNPVVLSLIRGGTPTAGQGVRVIERVKPKQ
ncbi:MAG TPA: alpha/beta fold hydrolase [Gemmatimonadaceae bacterium]|jgi:carboxylesterase|nr:alpha/beta fold hydrolase [Gemmatimonadaceae bacterium]